MSRRDLHQHNYDHEFIAPETREARAASVAVLIEHVASNEPLPNDAEIFTPFLNRRDTDAALTPLELELIEGFRDEWNEIVEKFHNPPDKEDEPAPLPTGPVRLWESDANFEMLARSLPENTTAERIVQYMPKCTLTRRVRALLACDRFSTDTIRDAVGCSEGIISSARRAIAADARKGTLGYALPASVSHARILGAQGRERPDIKKD